MTFCRSRNPSNFSHNFRYNNSIFHLFLPEESNFFIFFRHVSSDKKSVGMAKDESKKF